MFKQIPNTLTILRFPLTIVFLYGFFQPELTWRLAGTLCFLLSALTDLLDGIIARRMDSVSKLGAFLDPLADKFQTLSGFFALMMRADLSWGPWKILIIISVVVIAAREVFITIFRSYKAAKSKPLVTSFLGKAKTMTQMITLIVAMIVLAATDVFSWSHPLLLVLIGGGIIASAVLAAMSAFQYVNN